MELGLIYKPVQEEKELKEEKKQNTGVKVY
jgi:hypothetical protein